MHAVADHIYTPRNETAVEFFLFFVIVLFSAISIWKPLST